MTTGDDVPEVRNGSLDALRERADDAISEIARALDALPSQDYAARQTLAFASSELQHPAALPLLEQLALAPLPQEVSSDAHDTSVSEETVLRATAIEGLGHLAAKGEQGAIDALFACMSHSSLTLRAIAVRSILATPHGTNLRDRVVAALPEDQRFLLDLVPKRVHDVPQIADPFRHLSERARAEDRTYLPPPALPQDS